MDIVGGGEAFTLSTHAAARSAQQDADLWCAVQPDTDAVPQPQRISRRYRRLSLQDGMATVLEETSLEDLLHRLARHETVVIHQYLSSLATVDMLSAATPWQRHVLTSLGSEPTTATFCSVFEPHSNVAVAEISRYAAERSQRRGIPAAGVSAGIWRRDLREPLPKKPTGRLRAVSVGRLLPHKCFEVAIEAVGRDHEFTIVGPPSGDTAYEQFLAARIGTAENVRTTGYVDVRERTEIVAAADVLIANSSHTTYAGQTLDQAELFGLVILEAVAVGTLPLASDIPSFREIMEDLRLSDWIYPQRDAAALAALLARVDALPADELRGRVAAARAQAERLFLWDTYWDRLMRTARVHPTGTCIAVA